MIDSHAHIHFDAFAGDVPAVLHRAQEAGVSQVITVGVDTADSRKAVEMAATYESVYASVGIHPHDAGEAAQGAGYVRDMAGRRKVVAIGECGLDYFKSATSPETQVAALRMQIELALELDLPLIFHVRDAFEAFFPIIDAYPGVRGVVHSFTAGPKELAGSLERGLYVAVNGIVTFGRAEELRQAVRQVPGDRLLLETDCPFLAPAPNRGKRNEPAGIADIATYIAELRDESADDLGNTAAIATKELFKLP